MVQLNRLLIRDTWTQSYSTVYKDSLSTHAMWSIHSLLLYQALPSLVFCFYGFWSHSGFLLFTSPSLCCLHIACALNRFLSHVLDLSASFINKAFVYLHPCSYQLPDTNTMFANNKKRIETDLLVKCLYTQWICFQLTSASGLYN